MVISILCAGLAVLLFVIGYASGIRWLMYPFFVMVAPCVAGIGITALVALGISVDYAVWLLSDRVHVYELTEPDRETDRFTIQKYVGIGARPTDARTVFEDREYMCFRKCTDRHEYAAYCLTGPQLAAMSFERTGRAKDWKRDHHIGRHAPEWFAPKRFLGVLGGPYPREYRVYQGDGCSVFVVHSSWWPAISREAL